MTQDLTVDFVGELYRPDAAGTFIIGREADLVIDADNPFLHRQFLSLHARQGLWWLSNVGAQLSATIADAEGALQAWLAPGASLPLVFERTVVWFTAGSTTYEFDLFLSGALFEPVASQRAADGSMTIGRVTLRPDQKLLVVALCEDVLRNGRGAGCVPQSAVAAARLGWPLTTFNRKLDHVCRKLSDGGVRGLHGGPDKLASSRKARLVEYAMASRLVTARDLDLLVGLGGNAGG